jgi:hypothetical protein
MAEGPVRLLSQVVLQQDQGVISRELGSDLPAPCPGADQPADGEAGPVSVGGGWFVESTAGAASLLK